MEFRTYLEILQRRILTALIILAVLLAAVYGISKIIPTKYSTSAYLKINTPIAGSSLYVDFNIWYANRIMNTFVALGKSSSVVEELKQKLNLAKAPKTEVSVVPDSEVIEIIATDVDPQLSMKIANTLARIIIEKTSEVQISQVINPETVIRARLDQTKADQAEQEKQFQDLVKPLADINAQITMLENKYRQDEQVYVSLNDRYSESLLRGGLPSLLDPIQKQIVDLKATLDVEQKQLKDLRSKAEQYTEQLDYVKKQVDARNDEINNLEVQLDQIMMTKTIQETAVQLPILIEATAPLKPSSPNLLMIYLVGSTFSLLLTLILVYLIDLLDNRLHTAEQIENIARLPLLGRIPFGRLNNSRTNHSTDDSFIEEIRRLRVNILQVLGEENVRSVVFISTDPREGKSTLIANLGADLATFGKKVVIVDADLRLPSQHKIFHLSNETGLQTVLQAGGEIENISQYIQQVEGTGLYVLPGQQSSAEVTRLLGSPAMRSVIKCLEMEFDLVLVDSPAFLVASDTQELVSFSGGVVLIAQRGMVNRNRFQSVLKQLQSINTKILGLIINRDSAQHAYYSYYHRRKPALHFNLRAK